MSNEFVMVPRELLERYVSSVEGHGYGFDGDEEIRTLLDKPAMHQGEPVTLPARMKTLIRTDYADGWNACLALVEKLGPLYTHADPGEVERLESLLRASRTSLDNCALQIENLQTQLAELKEAFNDSQEEVIKRGKKLAECEALLRDCFKAMLKAGYAKPLRERIKAALSASAEPSAPEVTLVSYAEDMSTCTLTKGDGIGYFYDRVDAEPSAPVEIDERAAITLEQVLRAYDYAGSHPHKYLRGTTNWCAAVAHSLNEQARAALERNP